MNKEKYKISSRYCEECDTVLKICKEINCNYGKCKCGKIQSSRIHTDEKCKHKNCTVQ